jgi:hypothetical protein
MQSLTPIQKADSMLTFETTAVQGSNGIIEKLTASGMGRDGEI